MSMERSQLYYTCIFLHVSFQAIQRSLDDGKRGDDTPCWLDAKLIRMLSRELKRCRTEAASFGEVRLALDTAIYHCGLLLAQCPGALNRRLCQHHLEAIMSPLKEAAALLAAPSARTVSGHGWQASARRLLGWMRR